jgi:hypothetical protein
MRISLILIFVFVASFGSLASDISYAADPAPRPLPVIPQNPTSYAPNIPAQLPSIAPTTRLTSIPTLPNLPSAVIPAAPYIPSQSIPKMPNLAPRPLPRLSQTASRLPSALPRIPTQPTVVRQPPSSARYVNNWTSSFNSRSMSRASMGIK